MTGCISHSVGSSIGGAILKIQKQILTGSIAAVMACVVSHQMKVDSLRARYTGAAAKYQSGTYFKTRHLQINIFLHPLQYFL